MKFPQKIYICGKTFTVRLDPEMEGACGSWINQTITFGTKYRYHDEERMVALLHEIFEMILVQRDLRWHQPVSNVENQRFMFKLNHHEFTLAVQDLAAALKPFMKG